MTNTKAAKSKNVVLRKSKIQITKYKIQEKVCHITHTIGLLTTTPWYILYEEVFSIEWNISKRYMFTFEAQHKIFWYYTLYFGI